MTFGNTEQLSKPWISATTDNHFIVGIPSWHNGNIQARIVCIDTQGTVLWDRFLGTDQDDFFQRLFIDRDGNILVVGTTLGADDSATYQKNRDVFYLHYLTPQGQTIWEKIIPARFWNNFYSGNDVVGVQQDKNGDFLISAFYSNEFLVMQNWELAFFGTLAVVNSTGDLVDLYVHGNNPFYAPFGTSKGYGVFSTSVNGVGIIDFDRNASYRTPEDTEFPKVDEVEWNWADPEPFELDVWSVQTAPDQWQFVVVKEEGLVKFDYDAGSGIIQPSALEINSQMGSGFPIAATSNHNKFFVAYSNGTIYQLDNSWEVEKSFQTNWKILTLSSSPSGHTAVAFQMDEIIQVMIYDAYGKAIR